MGRPPYVDQHAIEIPASADRVWLALLRVMGRLGEGLPSGRRAAWGLRPQVRRGPWDTGVQVGDTIPGFTVTAADPPRLLVLGGGHRFSDYELWFELEPGTGGRTTLRAKTFAAFPGLKGAAYRLLVITSRGHPVAVRGLLARISRWAQADTTW